MPKRKKNNDDNDSCSEEEDEYIQPGSGGGGRIGRGKAKTGQQKAQSGRTDLCCCVSVDDAYHQ